MSNTNTRMGSQSGGFGRAGATPQSAADTGHAKNFADLTRAIDNKNLQELRGILNSLNTYASRNRSGATLAMRICSGEQKILGGLNGGDTLRQYCQEKRFDDGIKVLDEFAPEQFVPQNPRIKPQASPTSGRKRSNSGLSLGALVAQISPKPAAPNAGAAKATGRGVGGPTGHIGRSHGR